MAVMLAILVFAETIALANVVSAPFNPVVDVPAGSGQFTLDALSRPTKSGPVKLVQADRLGLGLGHPAD